MPPRHPLVLDTGVVNVNEGLRRFDEIIKASHVWNAEDREAKRRRREEKAPERTRLLSTLQAYANKPRPTAWERLLKDEDP
jgi:hypothetical protein